MSNFGIIWEYVMAWISYLWFLFLCAILCRYLIYWFSQMGDGTTDNRDSNPNHIVLKSHAQNLMKECNGPKTNNTQTNCEHISA